MNKRVIKHIIFCLLAFTCWSIFSCNDAASIDTNLVDIDLLDVQSESDFDISSYTVIEDSVLAFNAGFSLKDKYPFGIYEDPIFGTSTSSIVSQISLTTVSPPSFIGSVSVDSVVLEMALNPEEPFYGDSTQMIGIEVYELAESLDAATNYYSNYQAETEENPIGTFQGMPNFRDSVPIVIYQADTLALDTLPPVVRIKLNTNFGGRILNAGDDILTSPTEFSTMFKGIELRPTVSNTGMTAFDFGSYNSATRPGLPGGIISIYYKKDGIQSQYNVAINPTISVKFNQHQHNYAGTEIEEFAGDIIKGDEKTFVQGLSGTNSVVRFNDVDRLDGVIINGATLEVYGTAFNNDEDIRFLPEQLVLRELLDNGSLSYIRDFTSASRQGSLAISGGVPEDVGGGIFKYTFNVGSQLQDIIEGDRPNEIYIRMDLKVSNMPRAVLFGAGHSTYPIKLTVTYTKL